MPTSIKILLLLFVAAVLDAAVCRTPTHRDELHALGTTNTVAKFTGTASIGNSSATDDGTTFAINTNKFTVLESSGFVTTQANIQYGATAHVLSGGTPTTSAGSVATGSTNSFGSITGIGANNTVTVTYSTTFTNGSFCMATEKSNGGTPQNLQTDCNTSVMVVTCFDTVTGVAANCHDFYWHVEGR